MSSTKRRQKVRKVAEDLWYIVDLFDIRRPKLLFNHFATKKDAKRALRRFLKNNHVRYDVISGKRAIKNGIGFVEDGHNKKRAGKFRIRAVRIVKYNYPDDKKDRKERKVFRTQLRRRKKRGTIKIKRHQNTINELKP